MPVSQPVTSTAFPSPSCWLVHTSPRNSHTTNPAIFWG